MPALEMAQETGKLVSWKKKEGEQVKKGEMLLEVETDKAVVEIEARRRRHPRRRHREGRRRRSRRADDRVAAEARRGGRRPTVPRRRPDARWTSAPAAAAAAAAPAAPEPASVAGAKISPKARRLAREHGVDIATLRGSGPGGEILADDILKAAQAASGPAAVPAPAAQSTPTPAARPAAPPPPVATGPADAVSSIGRIMAERTTQSWTTVPHFFVDARRRRDGAQRDARAADPGDREVARREGHAHRPDGRRGRACAAAASRG